MDKSFQDLPPAAAPQHLNERVLAKRWGVSCRTLQRMRASGSGPAFLRLGNVVRYPLEDVLVYEARTRQSGVTGA